MSIQVRFALAAILACTAFAAPQGRLQLDQPEEYVALGVLEPEANDVGPYDRIVSATIDVLPEMSQLFEQIANDPRHPNDPERVQAIMNGFMPITRKVIVANAEVEGRRWSLEDQYRFNAAASVMPSVFSFMNRLRDSDFFGSRSRNLV